MNPTVLHIGEDGSPDFSEGILEEGNFELSRRENAGFEGERDLHASSILSNDVRAWPIWNQVDNWTSPKNAWKPPIRAKNTVLLDTIAPNVPRGRAIRNSEHIFDPSRIEDSGRTNTRSPNKDLDASSFTNQDDIQTLDWNRKIEHWGDPLLGRALSTAERDRLFNKSASSPNQWPTRGTRTIGLYEEIVQPPKTVGSPAPIQPIDSQGFISVEQLINQPFAHPGALHGQPAQPGQPQAKKAQIAGIKRRRGWLYRSLRAVSIVLLLAILVGGTMLYNFVQTQSEALPKLPPNPAALLSESSIILSSDGSELGHVFGERRKFVGLTQISPVTVQALLAAEDHRFYEHDGIDVRRIAGAAWSTFNGEPEGASTITMQLVRNYFPSVKRTTLAERKIREMLMARRITTDFSKDETLEWYLNTVAFGSNSFGIEAAAKRFFSSTSSDLTLSQSALLVGILKGPSRYNPFSNAELAKERRNLVIWRMKDLGMITDVQAREASAEPLGLQPSIYDPSESIAPHFVDYVRKIAEKWAAQNGYDLKKDGLKIRTTLDPNLQSLAVQAVAKQSQDLQNVITREFGLAGSRLNASFWRTRQSIEDDLLRKTSAYQAMMESDQSDAAALATLKNDTNFLDEVRAAAAQLEAGFVAIDPHSGQVKAWVGGRDYNIDQFDKVASAARQPGSVFKPFLYAAALDAGFSPYYLVEDRLKTFTTNTRGETWTPTNAGGGASGRLVTMRQGLAWSKNTVSAHLISRIGPQKVINLAKKMGITSPMLPVPSLALGTSETTLLEMVHSYATFADYGTFRNLTVITSIEDRNGNVIATFPSEPKRAISSQTAYTMIDMLRDVIDGGTGAAIRNKFDVRGDITGKTGTTQNNADGWFIAMHSDLVVGAWVGFNDQRIAFQSDYWGQGGHNALLLVGDFLQKATKGPEAILKTSRFTAPTGYRYPSKPVYSRPTPDNSDEIDPVTPPVQRVTPRTIGRLPISSSSSNN